jgi:hypothetical protein
MTFYVVFVPDHCPIKSKRMKRTINNNSVRLETLVEINGFNVKGRKRSNAVYQSQSARSAKSNSIQRNMAKLDNLETKLMNIAFKAKRSELQLSERMAKREARMNG